MVKAFMHAMFGMIGGAPSEDGAVFNPLHWLTCPGNYNRARKFAIRRAIRAGVVDGLRGRVRLSRLDDCAAMFLRVLVDRNYSAKMDADGNVIRPAVTEDEPGRALCGAACYCDRANWRDGTGHRQDKRRRYPLVPSMSAAGDNPATLVALREFAERTLVADAATIADALQGTDEEEKTGDTVAVEGGECYPVTDGRMIPTETRVSYVERPGVAADGVPFRFARVERGAGWTMDRRKAHKPQRWGPCEVVEAADTDAPRPRYAGHATLPPILRAQPGDGTAVRCVPFSLADEFERAAARREYDAAHGGE